MDERHHFTLMCRDLSEIATYARVDNAQYRLLKATTPGSYTFILEGTKELPRRVLHPKRKTIGLRVPDHPLVLALLEELDEPLLTSTLILPGDEAPLCDAEEIRDRLDKLVDLVIDAGPCGMRDDHGDQSDRWRAGTGARRPRAAGTVRPGLSRSDRIRRLHGILSRRWRSTPCR